MRPKILVINEPFVKGFCRTQRWAARTRGRVLRAPDWLAYCTAVLEKEGFNVKLYDFPADNWDKERLRRLIKDEVPDFVVLDSTTPSIYSDIECAKICKQESKARVIMVGPHISALPKETLEIAKDAVDVAVIGEYDYTIRDIIKNFNSLHCVNGIAYWKNEEVVLTDKRELIEDLDGLPFPAWSHLDLMRYFDGSKLYPYVDIISGRGCPNRCIFCLWPQVMHGTRYRLRSPQNVVDEIEYDIKLCPQVLKGGEFFFEDDTFTVDKERAIRICEEILKRNLKITFSVNARADSYDSKMFKMMKKAGCRELLVGFESADQKVLDNVNKNIKVEQMQEFMRAAKDADLEVHGCFVFGLPGETRETIQKTTDFALSLGMNTVQFSAAVPFPGTEYYQVCKDHGWLKSENWRDWLKEGEQSAVIEYESLTSSEIDKNVDSALKKFYLRPGYIFNFILKNRSFADFYRKARGGLNFFSYLLGK
ncbi:radical SAM protein [Candidatus Omnitrophota bacterium]